MPRGSEHHRASDFFPRVSVKSAEIEIGGKRYQILGVQNSINGNADPEPYANFAVCYVCTGAQDACSP